MKRLPKTKDDERISMDLYVNLYAWNKRMIRSRFLFHNKFLGVLMRKFDTEGKTKEFMHRLTEEGNISNYRKKCIKMYLNFRFKAVIYWTLVLNVIPIASEYVIIFSEEYGSYDKIKTEIIFAECFNAVLALVYFWDAIVRIGALGFRSYFLSKGNVTDFIITVIAGIQIVYAIVLFSAYQYMYNSTSLYVLISLSTMRLVRLVKVTIYEIFKQVSNQFYSYFYQAFDLAVGFITANDEISKTANKIVDHEEFANCAQHIAEKNIYEMLCFIKQIESEQPFVARAWRTHRATIYILRNMKQIVEEMENIYMIEESDAEHLLEEINSKLLQMFSYPRYMKTEVTIREILQNKEWITNEDILKLILDNYKIQSFLPNQIIQEVEELHPNLKVLYNGIIQVSGTSSKEKKEILPNTDSIRYLYNKGNFATYFNSPRTFGLLGYLLKTPSVTRITSSSFSELICIEYETISEIERLYGSLSFYMWRPIALQIAFTVLWDEEAYENWPTEKVKIHLEEGILPNLVGKTAYEVNPVIADIVLIQGRVQDKKSGTIYIGPAYIPRLVRSLFLLDDPSNRPRVVMVLLREAKFHALSVMGWTEVDDLNKQCLCLVHGRQKQESEDNLELMNTVLGHRLPFLQRLGKFLKPKDRSILKSESC